MFSNVGEVRERMETTGNEKRGEGGGKVEDLLHCSWDNVDAPDLS
jgi:hypothetical protein